VEQLSTSTNNSAKRIASLIDLHLGELIKIEGVQEMETDRMRKFNISDFIS